MRTKVLILLFFVLLNVIGCTANNRKDQNIGTATSCNVNDSEISSYYSGGCTDGLANGFGIAKGNDEYKGEFRNGLENGKGTYIWSEGASYTGEWKNGTRNGLGKLIISQNMWNTSYEKEHSKAKLIGNNYVEEGFFENDKFVREQSTSPNTTRIDDSEKNLSTQVDCKSVKQTETVYTGVNKVADKMIRSGNIGSMLYGGTLKLMYGAIPQGVRQGNSNCYPK